MLKKNFLVILVNCMIVGYIILCGFLLCKVKIEIVPKLAVQGPLFEAVVVICVVIVIYFLLLQYFLRELIDFTELRNGGVYKIIDKVILDSADSPVYVIGKVTVNEEEKFDNLAFVVDVPSIDGVEMKTGDDFVKISDNFVKRVKN